MGRLAILALLLSASAPAQETLPPFIPLKTPTLTFNNHYDFALKDGRIWFRPRRTLPEPGADDWKLLGPGGLPFRPGAPGGEPSRIAEISADATCLVAVADDLRIFDGELDEGGHISWNFGWGYPLRLCPKPVYLPPTSERRAWVYSLLNQEGYYSEDIDGNPHTIRRIDTVYVLSADGRSLRYNDPWLPPNQFEFWLAGPRRGAFEAISLAASGSTLFVVDRAGHLYTRLVDFDSMGGNVGITYSYEHVQLHYRPDDALSYWRGLFPFLFDVRALPADEWRAQPPIEGRITSRLTVLQTGRGNAARELRVEGADAEGHTGYWSKPIFGPRWTFVRSDLPVTGEWLDPGAPPGNPAPLGQDLSGKARIYPIYEGTPVDLRAELKGFNTYFEPATLRLFPEEGSQPLEVTLHIRPDSFPLTDKAPKRLQGGLVFAPAPSDEEKGRRKLRELLGNRRTEEVYVVISKDEVVIRANPFDQPQGLDFRMTFSRGP